MQKFFTKSLSRSLDPKGRLMLPPEYREALCAGAADGEQGTFWLTSFYGRLVAYLPADWEAVTEQLSRIRFPSPKLSHFKTKVMGLAQELMREAGLQKDVMLVGMLNKFEIWDQNRFDALQLEDVSEELAASGVDISL